MQAVQAALHDARPELKDCMRRADPVVPNLQYMLRVSLAGSDVGTVVTDVKFRRISGVAADRTAIETETTAAACVADLLNALELPPSGVDTMMGTVIRYDDCTPKDVLAKAAVQRYGAALATWSAANPKKTCPARLEELGVADRVDPWGRPYRLVCGAGVMSLGEDGVAGTADDVESWDDKRITRGL